jgi:hypothetical protein
MYANRNHETIRDKMTKTAVTAAAIRIEKYTICAGVYKVYAAQNSLSGKAAFAFFMREVKKRHTKVQNSINSFIDLTN